MIARPTATTTTSDRNNAAMAELGYASRVRENVTVGSRAGAEAEAETMRNLAYVVSSANDNIAALQKTVRQQEKELATKADAAAALQRNYETLSRIRQADQREFGLLKAMHDAQHAELYDARGPLSTRTRHTRRARNVGSIGARGITRWDDA